MRGHGPGKSSNLATPIHGGDHQRLGPALAEDATDILGEQTCDVWPNDQAYWRNIPVAVWD